MQPRTITREELYEEVWSKPMICLAKSFGLSDVGLAKLCKLHNVPRPPRGYWAKLEAGQKPWKIPLPPQAESSKISVHHFDESSLDESGPASEVQERLDAEKQEEKKIVVSENLRGAHSLVVAARSELEQATEDDSGILVSPGEHSLEIAVSKSQVRRALRILDALLKAFEARGYRVTKGPKFEIFDTTVSVGLKEAVTVEKTQPDNHDLTGPYEFAFSRYDTRRVPNGNLTLHVPDADCYWASGCRKQWRDGTKQRLENVLNRVVSGLIEVAARKRDHNIEMERQRIAEQVQAKKRKEAAGKRAELKEQQDAEKTRLSQLLDQAENYHKSQEIRQLVEAVRMSKTLDEDRLEAWAEWALMHADRFDPTKESPPSVLDEVLPEEPRRW